MKRETSSGKRRQLRALLTISDYLKQEEPQPVLIGMESGQLSIPLCRGLLAKGLNVKCVDARHMASATYFRLTQYRAAVTKPIRCLPLSTAKRTMDSHYFKLKTIYLTLMQLGNVFQNRRLLLAYCVVLLAAQHALPVSKILGFKEFIQQISE